MSTPCHIYVTKNAKSAGNTAAQGKQRAFSNPENTCRKTPENTGKRKEAQGKRGRSRAMEREVRTGERAGTAGTAGHLPLPLAPAPRPRPGITPRTDVTCQSYGVITGLTV